MNDSSSPLRPFRIKSELAVSLIYMIIASPIFATIMTVAIWFFTGMIYSYIKVFELWKLDLKIVFCIIAFVEIIFFFRRVYKHYICPKIFYSFDNSERNLSYIQDVVLSSKNENKRADAAFELAYILADTGKYEEALDVIKHISPERLRETRLAQYFNVYLYLLSVSGEAEKAKALYKIAEPSINKALCSDLAHEFFYTLGYYYYCIGDLSKSEDCFQKIYLNFDGFGVNAKLMTSLIYIKTGRQDCARRLLSEMFKYKSLYTDKQQKNFESLCSYIEKYYKAA